MQKGIGSGSQVVQGIFKRPQVHSEKNTGKMDVDATAEVNGVQIFDFELASLEDKPWRKPGADITDYFNYGFTEDTWNMYCERQRKLRSEYGGNAAAANKAFFQQIIIGQPNAHLANAQDHTQQKQWKLSVTIKNSLCSITALYRLWECPQAAEQRSKEQNQVIGHGGTVGTSQASGRHPSQTDVSQPPPQQQTSSIQVLGGSQQNVLPVKFESPQQQNVQVIKLESTQPQQQQQIQSIASVPSSMVSVPVAISTLTSSQPPAQGTGNPPQQQLGDTGAVANQSTSSGPPGVDRASPPPQVSEPPQISTNQHEVSHVPPPSISTPPLQQRPQQGVPVCSQAQGGAQGPPASVSSVVSSAAPSAIPTVTAGIMGLPGGPPPGFMRPPPNINMSVPPPGMMNPLQGNRPGNFPPGMHPNQGQGGMLPPTNLPPPGIMPPGVSGPPGVPGGFGQGFAPPGLRMPPNVGAPGFGGPPGAYGTGERERSPASYSDASSGSDYGGNRLQQRGGFMGRPGEPHIKRERSRSPPGAMGYRNFPRGRTYVPSEQSQSGERRRNRSRSRSRSGDKHSKRRSRERSNRRRDDGSDDDNRKKKRSKREGSREESTSKRSKRTKKEPKQESD